VRLYRVHRSVQRWCRASRSQAGCNPVHACACAIMLLLQPLVAGCSCCVLAVVVELLQQGKAVEVLNVVR